MTEIEKSINYRSPIIVGIIYMISYVTIQELEPIKGNFGLIVNGMILIFFRIIAGFWIYNLANQQGRKPILYNIIAVFFPAIVLIIIGLIGNKKTVTNKS